MSEHCEPYIKGGEGFMMPLPTPNSHQNSPLVLAKYGEKDTIEQVVFGMMLELSSSAVMERPVRRSSVISFKKRLAELGVKL